VIFEINKNFRRTRILLLNEHDFKQRNNYKMFKSPFTRDMIIMVRINIVSLKGGVGKSLIAFQLATKLSFSKKVVLVDRSLSKTISSFLGIKDEFKKGNYWKDLDSLRVIRFDYPANELDIVDEYKKLMEYDVMIVDNPPLLSDNFFDLDLTAWTKASNSYTYYSIIVLTPPDELIDYSLKIMLSINDFLEELISKSFALPMDNVQLFRPISIVINEVEEEYKIDYEKIRKYFKEPIIIKIPFKKELLLKPLSGELKEIDPLVEYIKSLT